MLPLSESVHAAVHHSRVKRVKEIAAITVLV